MHPAGCWTGSQQDTAAQLMPNNQVDKKNGAISQDSAWGGLVKKRLQPLLNLIYYPVHTSVHPLPDESVNNDYNSHENDQNKNRTRRVHQRPLSLAG